MIFRATTTTTTATTSKTPQTKPHHRIRKRIRPCLVVCETVEKKCPYMLPGDRAPAHPTQYAGEPTFLCLGLFNYLILF